MKTRAGIDLGYFIDRIIRNWYYIGVFLAISICIAYLLIASLPPKFKVTASLKVTESGNEAIIEDLFDGVQIIEEKKSTTNEIIILKSFDLVRTTLEKLDLKVSYFKRLQLKDRELYKDVPFEVLVDTTKDHIVNTPILVDLIPPDVFVIRMKDKNVEMVDVSKDGLKRSFVEEVNITDTLRSGEYFENEYLSFQIRKKDDIGADNAYSFKILDLDALAEEYRKKLSVSPINKDASILGLGIVSSVPRKEIDFLNKLTELYVERNLHYKNKIAQNTIDFIDYQLIEISDSLRNAEMALQLFRSDQKVLDINYESRNAYDDLRQLEKQKAEEQIKFKYYDYLSQYVQVEGNFDEIIAPSVMSIQDATLNNLITNLSDYIAQKTTIGYRAQERDPRYNELVDKIKNTREAILENVKNLKIASSIKLEDIQKRLDLIKSEINNLPKKERILLNAQRKFDFNDNIYNYLLEKRAEATILKASNISSDIIVDPARVEGKRPVAPNKKLILMLALGFGLFLSLVSIFLRDLISTKILRKEDIQNGPNPDYEILQQIPKSKPHRSLAHDALPDGSCLESFRALRLKIENLPSNKVIAVTSLIDGDGKSFCAHNLANTLRMAGSKVLLMDLSLTTTGNGRRPDSGSADTPNALELEGFHVNIGKMEYDKLEILTADNGKSDRMEISQSRFNRLMEKLIPDNDHIIVDCPAIRSSSNFLAVNGTADINLVVVRKNHTPMDMSEFRESGLNGGANYYYIFNHC